MYCRCSSAGMQESPARGLLFVGAARGGLWSVAWLCARCAAVIVAGRLGHDNTFGLLATLERMNVSMACKTVTRWYLSARAMTFSRFSYTCKQKVSRGLSASAGQTLVVKPSTARPPTQLRPEGSRDKGFLMRRSATSPARNHAAGRKARVTGARRQGCGPHRPLRRAKASATSLPRWLCVPVTHMWLCRRPP